MSIQSCAVPSSAVAIWNGAYTGQAAAAALQQEKS
jgi:hypothetical protein